MLSCVSVIVTIIESIQRFSMLFVDIQKVKIASTDQFNAAVLDILKIEIKFDVDSVFT